MDEFTVNEIVKKYLEENGFDGLCDGTGCGCSLKDLMGCNFVNFNIRDCIPGYDHGDCEDDIDEQYNIHGYCIKENKPEQNKLTGLIDSLDELERIAKLDEGYHESYPLSVKAARVLQKRLIEMGKYAK